MTHTKRSLRFHANHTHSVTSDWCAANPIMLTSSVAPGRLQKTLTGSEECHATEFSRPALLQIKCKRTCKNVNHQSKATQNKNRRSTNGQWINLHHTGMPRSPAEGEECAAVRSKCTASALIFTRFEKGNCILPQGARRACPPASCPTLVHSLPLLPPVV